MSNLFFSFPLSHPLVSTSHTVPCLKQLSFHSLFSVKLFFCSQASSSRSQRSVTGTQHPAQAPPGMETLTRELRCQGELQSDLSNQSPSVVFLTCLCFHEGASSLSKSLFLGLYEAALGTSRWRQRWKDIWQGEGLHSQNGVGFLASTPTGTADVQFVSSADCHKSPNTPTRYFFCLLVFEIPSL